MRAFFALISFSAVCALAEVLHARYSDEANVYIALGLCTLLLIILGYVVSENERTP